PRGRSFCDSSMTVATTHVQRWPSPRCDALQSLPRSEDEMNVKPWSGAALLLLLTGGLSAQTKLSVKWEELTAPEFVTAIQRAQGTCVLPFGIREKHGPHLPLGTDLINVRYAALHAAEQEYAVVFPEYYFGQIFEAKHEPGTIAYSLELQLKLLQETTDEMARNGCKKIVIANGHGGNEH